MERIKLKSAQQISPMMAGKSGKIRLFESVYVGRGYPLCLLPIPGTSLRRKLLEIQDDTGNSGRTRHRSRSIFLRAFPTPWTGSGGGGRGRGQGDIDGPVGSLADVGMRRGISRHTGTWKRRYCVYVHGIHVRNSRQTFVWLYMNRLFS